VQAVKDLSFSVGEAEIVGLIGPNGSGKSTSVNLKGLPATPATSNCVSDGSPTGARRCAFDIGSTRSATARHRAAGRRPKKAQSAGIKPNGN
jgi:ABC-type branched-subunit amino acid transport system ATPase component